MVTVLGRRPCDHQKSASPAGLDSVPVTLLGGPPRTPSPPTQPPVTYPLCRRPPKQSSGPETLRPRPKPLHPPEVRGTPTLLHAGRRPRLDDPQTVLKCHKFSLLKITPLSLCPKCVCSVSLYCLEPVVDEGGPRQRTRVLPVCLCDRVCTRARRTPDVCRHGQRKKRNDKENL